jgi:putative ABC transport system permease protein
MGIRDMIYETWFSLTANKARSFLTTLGIIIGIASVIAMSSLIGGMQDVITGRLGLFQARMVQIFSTVPMQETDLDAVMQAFPEYEAITQLGYYYTDITTGEQASEAQLLGVTSSYDEVYSLELRQGRGINEDDELRASRVMILGPGLTETLFGDSNAPVVGTTVRVGPSQETYTIIGVLASDIGEASYSGSLIPLSTMQSRLTGSDSVDNFSALASANASTSDLARDTARFLNERLGSSADDNLVTGVSMEQMLEDLGDGCVAAEVIIDAERSHSTGVPTTGRETFNIARL